MEIFSSSFLKIACLAFHTVKISLGLNYEAKSNQKLSKEYKISDNKSLFLCWRGYKYIDNFIYLLQIFAIFIDLLPANELRKTNRF